MDLRDGINLCSVHHISLTIRQNAAPAGSLPPKLRKATTCLGDLIPRRELRIRTRKQLLNTASCGENSAEDMGGTRWKLFDCVLLSFS